MSARIGLIEMWFHDMGAYISHIKVLMELEVGMMND